MAIPSGSGTEVLKRVTLHSGSGWNEIFSGTANHIYTILSIVAHEQGGATGTIGMRINDGTNDIYIFDVTTLGAYESFVWNDRLVLEGDDDIDVYSSTADVDWYISYIDQDWT